MWKVFGTYLSHVWPVCSMTAFPLWDVCVGVGDHRVGRCVDAWLPQRFHDALSENKTKSAALVLFKAAHTWFEISKQILWNSRNYSRYLTVASCVQMQLYRFRHVYNCSAVFVVFLQSQSRPRRVTRWNHGSRWTWSELTSWWHRPSMKMRKEMMMKPLNFTLRLWSYALTLYVSHLRMPAFYP